MTTTTHPHEVHRLAIAVRTGFDHFRDRYEQSVPNHDSERFAALVREDGDGTTWFSVDQPSTRFRSFDDPAITDVGLELDHKLAALLEHLGAPVPPALAG
jgi:hypothetical protein